LELQSYLIFFKSLTICLNSPGCPPAGGVIMADGGAAAGTGLRGALRKVKTVHYF